MSAIPGLRGTGDWATDQRPKDFKGSILRVSPNGNTPLFALTSRSKKRVVTDPEYYWWAEPQNLVRLQVNGALASGDTLITVNSADPTASTLGAHYGTAQHLKQGDLLLVEPAADAAVYDHEIIEVVSTLSDTQFVARRAAAGTTAASISDDIYLLKIGSAYGEGGSAPPARSRNPVKYYNLTQIFKDTYELTRTADKTKTRTGDEWSNDKKRKAFDHSRDIEMAMWFSKRSEVVDTITGKPKRTMNGLRNQVGNVTIGDGTMTVDDLMTAIEPVFKYNVGGGSNTRVAFAGNGARMEIAKMIQAATGVSIEIGPNMKQWGMDFETWRTPLGTVLFKTHPLFSQHSLYNYSAFILDFEALEYVTLEDSDTKTKDDVQAKDEDLRRGYMLTECSISLDGGGLSCAYIGNIRK